MFSKIAEALKKTQQKIAKAIRSILPFGKKLSASDIDYLEEVLISADVGFETTTEIIDELKKRLKEGEISGEDALTILKNHLLEILGDCPPITVTSAKPHVIFLIGVNGTGKTTTIGKLAHRYKALGKTVLVAAGDTFRAAAGEQLEVWAQRAGVEIFTSTQTTDPAALLFDAIKYGCAKNYDIIVCDTAGRLHTKKNLMEELRKIDRVAHKAMPEGAKHDTFIVVDASTGQNGLTQAEMFNDAIPLTGIILTKLDGTAKGGIAVAIRRNLRVPIRAVGIGEKIEDLIDFNPVDYVRSLIELEEN